MDRVQKQIIIQDLKKKMVILVGPRQAGKTWLAKDIAKNYNISTYLNYDIVTNRNIINNQEWPENTELLILDELHKMPYWKNYLKGLVDDNDRKMHILVTGSARLEVYDRIGDSLAGRYFKHRLLPISMAEITQVNNTNLSNKINLTLDDLITRSGFPEPLFATNLLEAGRWRDQYISSLMSTDIFEIDPIQNIKAMHLVFNLLRTKVGSPVSYNSLAEDVNVSPITIKKYIQILESLFMIFPVTPHSNNIARSLLKEPKIYFFDPGLVNGDDGAKLENIIAIGLLKNCYAKSDCLAQDYKLHYLRTIDGEEVDFVLINNNNPETMIEVKLSKTDLSKTLIKFNTKYNIPAVQLVKNLKIPIVRSNVSIDNAENYLKTLYL